MLCHFWPDKMRKKTELLDHIVIGDMDFSYYSRNKATVNGMVTYDTAKSKWQPNRVSTYMIMAIMFCIDKFNLLIDFMPQGTTINSAAYCTTLRKLWCTIQNKQCDLLSSEVLSCCCWNSRVNHILWMGTNRTGPRTKQLPPVPLFERISQRSAI